MSRMGTAYIHRLNDEVPPLTDEYLTKCEQDARRFSACWDAGTSGTLAGHVMRLLRELARVKGVLAVERARRHEEPYWRQPHD